MKPLNYDNSPCSPTSSNCVIWQGPDLDCIKLCKGDTISDVIANLATELCTVMDQLSITNYDLSCFELVGCKPETYQELLQFLIEQICLAQGLSTTGTSTDGKTNDTLITVAPCFIVNGITVMTLTDYVIAIGLRICSIIDQIALINNTLNELDIRITNLETAIIPTYTLPSIPADCILAPGSYPLDTVLNALMNNDTLGYCALLSATGTPASLISSVLSQCITNSNLQLSTGTAYSANANWNSNWNTTDVTVAASLRNIWVVLCDIYSYLKNIITVQDTNTVNLTLTSSNILSAEVQDTGWVKLEGFDTYMNDTAGTLYEYPQVRRIGNQLHFKGNIVIPLAETTSALRPWLYTATVNNYEEDPSTGNATTIATPYQGTGGVITGSFGSITFNRNALGSAQSVIPVSVIPSSYQLDGAYQHPAGFKISQRIIKIASGTSTMLTTLLAINLSATGILSLGLVKNAEESNINGSNNAFDTSHLNYIISHVISGQNVPQFKTSSNIVHSKPVPTPPSPYTSDLNLDFPIGTYPFSCNANDETEIGGFFMSITGLTAFISPCETLIPTPTPCAIP
jgi:hypothetical protein